MDADKPLYWKMVKLTPTDLENHLPHVCSWKLFCWKENHDNSKNGQPWNVRLLLMDIEEYLEVQDTW